jgi:hypothetical protein
MHSFILRLTVKLNLISTAKYLVDLAVCESIPNKLSLNPKEALCVLTAPSLPVRAGVIHAIATPRISPTVIIAATLRRTPPPLPIRRLGPNPAQEAIPDPRAATNCQSSHPLLASNRLSIVETRACPLTCTFQDAPGRAAAYRASPGYRPLAILSRNKIALQIPIEALEGMQYVQ